MKVSPEFFLKPTTPIHEDSEIAIERENDFLDTCTTLNENSDDFDLTDVTISLDSIEFTNEKSGRRQNF